MLEWIDGPYGTTKAKLPNGQTVTLGHSDSAYPPGNPDKYPLKLNSTDLWFKLEAPEEAPPVERCLTGWWAKAPRRSMHQIKAEIDAHGWGLPDAMMAVYYRTRVEQMADVIAKLEYP